MADWGKQHRLYGTLLCSFLFLTITLFELKALSRLYIILCYIYLVFCLPQSKDYRTSFSFCTSNVCFAIVFYIFVALIYREKQTLKSFAIIYIYINKSEATKTCNKFSKYLILGSLCSKGFNPNHVHWTLEHTFFANRLSPKIIAVNSSKGTVCIFL